MSQEVAPTQNVTPTQGDVEISTVQEVSLPLYQARGWMKLTGILYIISGVITALSIVGILIAWLPIWMGVVLYKSASSAEPAQVSGRKLALVDSLSNLKTFFTIMGVMNLLGIIFLVGGICVFLIAMISGVAWLDSINY